MEFIDVFLFLIKQKLTIFTNGLKLYENEPVLSLFALNCSLHGAARPLKKKYFYIIIYLFNFYVCTLKTYEGMDHSLNRRKTNW